MEEVARVERFRRSRAIAVALLAVAGGSSAARAESFYIETLWFNPDPPSISGPFSGLIPMLSGPYPLDLDVESVASLDIGASSPRAELLLQMAGDILWLDLDADEAGLLAPAPPVTFSAMTAFSLTGTARLDLVGTDGASLWVLDLDAASPQWSAPVPLPFTAVALASADVVPLVGPELVASDGTRVWALVPPAIWTELEAPLVPPDLIVAADVALGAPGFPLGAAVRLVAAHSGGLRALYLTDPEPGEGPWVGPTLDRFARRIASPLDPADPPPSVPAGALFFPEPLATTPVLFENEAALLGLDAPLSPGGDGHCPGAVFTDLSGDGWPDLYLVRGFGGAGPENQLRLSDGAGGFLPPRAGAVADPGNGAGALAIDVDNDGDRDLYVINFDGRNTLLENRAGVFVDVTESTDPTPADPPADDQEGIGAGVSFTPCEPGEPLPCALDDTLAAGFGDFNRDGYLDLYVGNHLCCDFPQGERDILYLANGDGTFRDITLQAGISSAAPPAGHPATQALLVTDLNDDGWPDIYVTNKGNGPSRDQLFLNAGDADGNGWDGHFVDWIAGQPLPIGDITGAAMGIDAGDFDGDGDLDLFMTDIHEMDLMRNRTSEDGVFSLEIVQPNPVPSPNFAWGTSWLDVDNDGHLDLHVATNDGVMDYLHRGDGAGGFSEIAFAAGVGQAWNSRASVAADYDRDGRVDLLVVQQADLPPSLFHNQSPLRSWLEVELEGAPGLPGPYRSSRDAVGARIDVVSGGGVQRRDVVAGGHTCGSTRDYVAHFGLAAAAQADELRVHWPSGRLSVHRDVAANQLFRVSELDDCGADSDGDGLGDGCECGDVSDDGRVAVLDAALITRRHAGLAPALPAPDKCNVAGAPGACGEEDAGAVRQLLAGLVSELPLICEPILP